MHLETAFFIFEKGYVKISDNLNAKCVKKFEIYKNIIFKTRTRAANKIGSWWIPICYDVNRESGKRLAENSWNRVCTYVP